MGHTPGPWKVAADNCIDTANDEFRIGLAVGGAGDYRANARLMAASPDLLAFVRECATDDLDRVSGGLKTKARRLLKSITDEDVDD